MVLRIFLEEPNDHQTWMFLRIFHEGPIGPKREFFLNGLVDNEKWMFLRIFFEGPKSMDFLKNISRRTY